MGRADGEGFGEEGKAGGARVGGRDASLHGLANLVGGKREAENALGVETPVAGGAETLGLHDRREVALENEGHLATAPRRQLMGDSGQDESAHQLAQARLSHTSL